MSFNRRNRDDRSCRIEPLEDRRLFAAGALDTSFSEDGKASIDINFGGITLEASDVAVQQDGKTVVVGKFALSATRSDFGIARLNVDGTPDRTFGPQGNGFVRSPVGDGGDAAASAVAIQPDGRIVVVGSALQESGFDEDELAIARYLPNGTSDNSFDGDGVRTLDVGNFSSWSYANDVAIQGDGKIVVVGRTYRVPNDDFFVVRFNPGGSLDGSFDGDGKKFIGFGDEDEARAVTIDQTGTPVTNPHYGTIYIAGNASFASSNARVGLVRLNPNGSNVDSFDGDGKVTFAFPSRGKTFVSGVMAQPDGKVVIAGHSGGDFFVARYLANGGLDTTFGGLGTGFASTDFGGSESSGGIARAPAGGSGFFVSGTSGGFAVAKYTNDGRLDTTFGTGGKARVAGFGGNARIAPGPGKRITLAGGAKFATARLLDAGANVVSVSPLFNSTAHEAGRQPASLFVYRSERLPVPTRVFLASSGTATAPTSPLLVGRDGSDFTGWSNLLIIGGGPRFVDIPANQTFVELPITPVDDTRVEGNETFRLTVLPSAAYDIGVGSGTITIRDNEVTALTATADAYVRDGSSAGLNFGNADELQVRNASGNNRRTYLKFDISSIVTTFGTAKLRLFGSAAGSGSVAVSAFGAADTTWSESGITFNNKPAPTGSALSSQTVTSTTARWYEWDLTSYIAAARAAGQTTVTIVLRNLTSSPTHATFASDESGDFRPQLWLTPRFTVSPLTPLIQL